MDTALLSRSAEPLARSPFVGSGGEIWNWLQNLKEEVSRDLLREGPLCKTEILGLREGEESSANAWDIEWLRRICIWKHACATLLTRKMGCWMGLMENASSVVSKSP